MVRLKYFVLAILLAVSFGSHEIAYAKKQNQKSAKNQKRKTKVLEFDEGMVEGVSKKSGGFAAITHADGRKKMEHLYSKEINFKPYWDNTVRATGISQ